VLGMRRHLGLLGAGAGVAILFILVAQLLGPVMGLAGRDLWILRGGFWILGGVAALLVVLYLRPRRVREPALEDDEIELGLRAARKQLTASPLGSRGRPERLPLILIMGPTGSAKTTTVMRSGLEPELLAGDVFRGEMVVPTPGINVWFAQGAVLVEAGGAVLEADARWARLAQAIQPARLAAALSAASQPPRAAVICFGCDELVKPGAGQALEAAARILRGRLAHVSERLGIRLPVYVIFTKADRLPHFADYVRSFSREEAAQVLGATLPAPAPAATAAYVERESRRIDAALRELGQSLADKRLDVLAREATEETRAGAYEFPREFRKVSERVANFLVELCRPSQLRVSPYLRGFYFTGVRSIVVDEAVAEPGLADPLGARQEVEATAMFDAQRLIRTTWQAPQRPTGGRKVPEWVFLPRLFRDVVLADESALRGTGGGTRVHLLRRSLVGAAAALALILSAGFAVSYTNNRALQRQALDAARAIAAHRPVNAGAPTLDELTRLEALRAQAERLTLHQRERRPWRMRWGLYTGAKLAPPIRQLYFDRFEQVLWGPAQVGLLAALHGLPEAPTEQTDYGASYDALKAHLITTSDPDKSTAGFLTPVLLSRWPGARELDAERLDLSRRQFDFFAEELRYGNPLPAASDPAAVARARAFLAEFADEERVYQSLVFQVSERTEPVEYHRLVPGSETVVRNPRTVPGAFTREGWRLVHERLNQVDALFAGEQWVVGSQPVPTTDRQLLAAELRQRYVADYTRHWGDFLQQGAVQRFSGAADAARKLDRLSQPESPLLKMLAMASDHTAVDPAVASAFQPLHHVLPPDSDRPIGGANEGYMAALLELYLAFEQLATAAGPARDAAEAQASSNAEGANRAIRQLAQSFDMAGDARRAGEGVRRLLEAPIAHSEGLLRLIPLAELNQQGRSFCGEFDRLLAKYPFNPRGSVDAELDEVAAMFEPGRSRLWGFYDEHLSSLLVPRGEGFAASTTARPRPSSEFTQFFNRAADVSRGFFGSRGNRPEIPFVIRAHTTGVIEEVVVMIEGRTHRFSRRLAGAQHFVWSGAQGSSARIAVVLEGAEVVVAEPRRGPWAVFRLFQDAQWEPAGRDGFVARWRVPGRDLTISADILFDEGRPPLFRAGYFGGLRCVAQIAR
jgi:type VI secretion system protein ImpL